MDMGDDKRKFKEIPAQGDYQYIYKKRLDHAVDIEPIAGYSFRFIDSIWNLNGRLLRQMFSRWGMREFLKSILRIMILSRKLYCLTSEKGSTKNIVSFGWITIGRCKRYEVGEKGVVIGLIKTDEKVRGQGLATYSLKKALNSLFERGYRDIYIDTFIDNLGPQRVFKKCGFQGPVDCYLRTDKRQALYD